MKKYIVYLGILASWSTIRVDDCLVARQKKIQTKINLNAVTETNQMWTCSMHPQIMQPEAGDCPICGMDLIPAE